jgi:glycine cleavage system H protein
MRYWPNDTTVHAIVPVNVRCVWMTGGILSYQLCDRQFECEHCPLDAAMRMHFSRHKQRSPEHNMPGDTHLPNILYSRNHCWLKPALNGIVRVGIESGFASILHSVKAVVLPSVKDKLKYEEWCTWIVSEGGTIPLRAPVSGAICAINVHLSDHPSEVICSPLEKGWLFDIEVKKDEFIRSHMMDTVEAKQQFDADEKKFQKLLREAIHPDSDIVGMTLHDGGTILNDASDMLGEKRYVETVRRVYGG